MKVKCVFVVMLTCLCLAGPLLAKGDKSQKDVEPGFITAVEVDNLIHLREEEKLARDVYLALYEIWEAKIFLNISASEQSHMDAVKRLLDKYDQADPVVDDSMCKFTYQEFSELCHELIEQGEESLEEALEVGIFIEELDIADIEDMLEETYQMDIRRVLANLVAGSYNHLEAFENGLDLMQ